MITNKIETFLKETLQDLEYEADSVEVIVSNRSDISDYQYDGSFKLAKVLHKSPIEIGTTIVEKLKEKEDIEKYFQKIEVLPPGFINFTLSNDWINETINEIAKSEKFNISLPKKETIVIDYGGPNIAKPLHVGHLRSAIVGESIKRMLKYMGHNVISDVHLGDYGLQIGEVIYGVQEKGIPLEDITLEDLETIYPEMSGRCKEDEELKEKCASITKDLQDGKEEYLPYFEKIKEISGNDILRIYKYLDVSFDLWQGESDAYPYIEPLTKELESRKLLTESEGAKVVFVNKESDAKELPPMMYQKKNGAYLYGTTDLATIYERRQKYHPDDIIYLADFRQSLHFETVFRVCEKLGYTKDMKLEHLAFGTVNGTDGKPFKTRAGNSPKLDSLFKEVKEAFLKSNEKNENMTESDLDIIVNAIIKFADLQNNREKDYIFDINKFSSVVGKTGPYILYTYLRIASILKKEQYTIDELNKEIYDSTDREVRRKLIELSSTLNHAVELRMPSILANYLYELCVNMNAFYEKNHINNLEDRNKKENWLFLLDLGNKILKEMLDLLGIKIPERM